MENLHSQKNVLIQAIRKQQWEEVVRLASPELVNKYDESGQTPLIRAVEEDAPDEVIKKIIQKATEECFNHKSSCGRTFLHRLSWFTRSDVLRSALEFNSNNINAQDLYGQTPLNCCLAAPRQTSFEDHRKTATILLKYGGSTTIKDHFTGVSPIDVYIRNPCYGYDKNLKDKQKKELLKILEEQSIPTEIIARGEETIKAYKDELNNGQITLVNSRIMMLGKEGVGKTTCVKKLLDKELNQDEPSTDGIVTTIVFQTVDDNISVWEEQKTVDVSELIKTISQDSVAENVAKKFQDTKTKMGSTSSSANHRQIPGSSESSAHDMQAVKERINKAKKYTDTGRSTVLQLDNIPEKTFSQLENPNNESEKTKKGESIDYAGQTIHDITHRDDLQAVEGRRNKARDTNLQLNDIPEKIRLKIFFRLKNPTTESEKVKKKIELTTIMDYAGQIIYQITHRFYLTNGSVYVVVFSLADKLNDLAKPRDGVKGPLEMTNLQAIVFFIRSIYEHAILPYESQKRETIDGRKRETIDGRIASPPICLVGTHKDKLEGSEEDKNREIEAVKNQIFDEIKDMPYEKHVDNKVHVVDNTDKFDEGIEILKKVAGGYMKTMSREVPTNWVDLQVKIQESAKTKLSMSKDEITKIAVDCGISKIETALVYMNDVGIILYSKMNEKLKNIVITNPPMMSEMLTKIITSVNPNFQDPLLKKLWNMLDRDGILDKSLLHHLWKDEIEQNPDILEVFVEVMKMFSLVFEMQGKQDEQVLLVPCLMKVTTDSLEVKKDDKQTASVYVTPTDFLPDSVYSVLVVGMLNFMETKGRSTKGNKHVKLFQNRSDFDLYDDHRVSLGAVKIERRHALKLELSRLPTYDEDGTEVTHAAGPRPSVCFEVINYLKDQLQTVYGTTKGIGYNLHVCCNMCPSQPSTLFSLHNLDECLNKDTMRCDDKVVSTAHFKRLFAGSTEELSTTFPSPGKQSVTERTKATTQQFRSLLTELSDQYRGSNYHWLRFLLFGYLPIQILSTDGDNGLALFNVLETQGNISCSNVIILSEIAETTKVDKAKSYIAKYTSSYECEEGTVLSKFRKTLFSALREVSNDELPRLIAYYQLGHYKKTFRDVWDLTYYLEKERRLDTPEKVKTLAGLLNEVAKDIMLEALT